MSYKGKEKTQLFIFGTKVRNIIMHPTITIIKYKKAKRNIFCRCAYSTFRDTICTPFSKLTCSKYMPLCS